MEQTRARRTQEEIAELLSQLGHSGLSVRAFAKKVGVAATSVYEWRRKAPSKNPTAERIRKLTPKRAPLTSPIEIAFPQGLKIRLNDSTELEQVLKASLACLG